MRLYLLGFLLVILVPNHTKAQLTEKKPILPDTIKETIIYEYDTVYLAPDTVKLIDTIVRLNHATKNKNIKHKQNHLNFPEFKFLNKINILSGFDQGISSGFGVYPFVTGFYDGKNTADSFSTSKSISLLYEVHANYEVNRLICSLGIGYTPLLEKLKHTTYSNSSTQQNSTNGVYDSLLIVNNCVSTNYYKYLNLFFNFGRKWGSSKIFFTLNGQISTDILISANAIWPSTTPERISSSSIRKIDARIGLYPSIGYKLARNLNISFVPFCSYSLSNMPIYPASNHLVFGIGCKIQ